MESPSESRFPNICHDGLPKRLTPERYREMLLKCGEIVPYMILKSTPYTLNKIFFFLESEEKELDKDETKRRNFANVFLMFNNAGLMHVLDIIDQMNKLDDFKDVMKKGEEAVVYSTMVYFTMNSIVKNDIGNIFPIGGHKITLSNKVITTSFIRNMVIRGGIKDGHPELQETDPEKIKADKELQDMLTDEECTKLVEPSVWESMVSDEDKEKYQYFIVLIFQLNEVGESVEIRRSHMAIFRVEEELSYFLLSSFIHESGDTGNIIDIETYYLEI